MRGAARRRGVALTTVVLSDHGMTNVTRIVDPWSAMETGGRRLGRDFLAFLDSTMVRVWGDAGAVGAAEEAMGGHGRRLGEDELRSLGCWFAGRDYGETILLANPGTLVVPSFMGSSAIAAMHGYHPEDAFSKGCFFSDAASIAPPASLLGFKSYLQTLLRGSGNA
jgi:hypothetical protein